MVEKTPIMKVELLIYTWDKDQDILEEVIDAMKQLVGTGNMSKLNKISKLTSKDRRYDETGN